MIRKTAHMPVSKQWTQKSQSLAGYKIGPGAKLTVSFEDAEQDNVSGTDVDADFLGVGLLLKF